MRFKHCKQNIVIIEITRQIWYNYYIMEDMGVRMNISKNRKGFTLAEVMIVLLVLTILFAACAPLITKRQRSSATKQEMWKWSSRNYMAGPMDTYYKPITNNYLGGIYIGTEPDSDADVRSSFTPVSKLVVRSGFISNSIIQRQLQLRFGRSIYEDPGQLAATFLADNYNLLFGKNFPGLKNKTSEITYPTGNVVFGFNSMNDIMDRGNVEEKPDNNTAFGSDTYTITHQGKDNTYIGSKAGNENQTGNGNTMIGYNAGSNAKMSLNTLIGYNSQAALGNYNTFAGAFTGNQAVADTDGYRYDVALGYEALGSITSGEYNVAIGAHSLKNLTTGNYNTAIGYNSCFGVTTQSNITCIGANSGPASDSPVYTELGIKPDDTTPRTYIGSNPNLKKVNSKLSDNWEFAGNYGGDAVLEIHNSIGTGNSYLINNPSIVSNATTIINGNLIVRGKTFFTIGDVLHPFYYNESNIFGTTLDEKCAQNQVTYDFSNSGNCATLAPITSDRRLKNIKSRNNLGLEKIKQLKVFNYVFKDDKDITPHVGVIAQDLQKIFPNSVSKGSDGFLKIKLEEIFYAAINAIKEIHSKIANLYKETEKLEQNINKMEKENKKLQAEIDSLSARINALKK